MAIYKTYSNNLGTKKSYFFLMFKHLWSHLAAVNFLAPRLRSAPFLILHYNQPFLSIKIVWIVKKILIIKIVKIDRIVKLFRIFSLSKFSKHFYKPFLSRHYHQHYLIIITIIINNNKTFSVPHILVPLPTIIKPYLHS